MPLADVSASDWHRPAAFRAFFVFGYSIFDNGVAASLDEFFSAVWAVCAFIFVTVNVTEIRIENSGFSRHSVCSFQGLDLCGWVVKLVGGSISCEV